MLFPDESGLIAVTLAELSVETTRPRYRRVTYGPSQGSFYHKSENDFATSLRLTVAPPVLSARWPALYEPLWRKKHLRLRAPDRRNGNLRGGPSVVTCNPDDSSAFPPDSRVEPARRPAPDAKRDDAAVSHGNDDYFY